MSELLSRMDLDSGAMSRDTCPKCAGPLANLTGTAVNVDQFRREDGRCFLFYSTAKPLLECRTGGPYHGPR